MIWADARAARDGHSSPSVRSGRKDGPLPDPNQLPLPEFNSRRVREVAQELLQKFKTSNPDNWIELQIAAGSVLLNPTNPRKLPKFDQERVGQAVESIVAAIDQSDPQSWRDLSRILRNFTDTIPNEVMENIIAFQVLKGELKNQQEERDKNQFGKKSDDPFAGNADVPGPGLDPDVRKALEKEVDDTVGKFADILPKRTNAALPSATAGAAFPPAAGGSGKGRPGSEVSRDRGTRERGPSDSLRDFFRTGSFVSNNTTTPGPTVAAASPPMKSVVDEPPADSDPESDALGESAPMTPPGSPSAQQAQNALVPASPIQPAVPTPAPQAASLPSDAFDLGDGFALTLKAPPSFLAGEPLIADPPGFPVDEPRLPGTVETEAGIGGGVALGDAPEGDGDWGETDPDEGIVAFLMNWVAAALGADEEAGSKPAAGRDPARARSLGPMEASTWGGFAQLLEKTGVDFGAAHRERVIADLAARSGMSGGTAALLYYLALLGAWGATGWFAAYLGRKVLWPRLKSRKG